MADLREEFFSALKEDIKSAEESGEQPFLYRWLAKEKQRDFRLTLKVRRKKLKDTPESRRSFGAFLLKSLLEDPKLRPIRGSLETLPPLLMSVDSPAGGEAPLQRLRQLMEDLEAGKADLPWNGLTALSAELLDSCPRPKKRTDAYRELQERFFDLTAGDIDAADYLRGALDLLIAQEQLRLDETSREMLEDYSRSACKKDLFDGSGAKTEKYRQFRRLLDRPGLPPMDPANLRHLHQNLLDALLGLEAQAFLYDSGQTLSDSGPRQKERPPRRKDRVMDMLSDYCQENGLSPWGRKTDAQSQAQASSPSSGVLSEDEKKAYEALFHSLEEARKVKVLIPIQLDPISGAGLYIVGRRRFSENEIPVAAERGQRNRNCCYACFYLSDIIIEENGEVAFHCEDMPLEALCFSNLEQALEKYEEFRRKKIFLHFYKSINGAPPPQCPPALRHYFRSGGGQSLGESMESTLDHLPTAEEISAEQRAAEREQAAQAEREARQKKISPPGPRR